jgi:hypothetical protein
MVVDACRRLERFASLGEYRYLGFGAYEFVDFELVRRELGIVAMDSIESEGSATQRRYLFNRPFEYIDIHFDRASNVLPSLLDDAVKRIAWLDYTDWLDREVLADVGTCLRKLPAGSVLLVTVRARPEGTAKERLAHLQSRVGRERIPEGVDDEYLAKHMADVQRDILTVSVRGHIRRRVDGARFMQLFDLRYKDGTPMQTWGGLVVSPDIDSAVAAVDFGALEQTSLLDQPPVDATVPTLTMREVLHLNSQLPCAGPLAGEDIPADDLDAYRRLYRWYPPVPVAM